MIIHIKNFIGDAIMTFVCEYATTVHGVLYIYNSPYNPNTRDDWDICFTIPENNYVEKVH